MTHFCRGSGCVSMGSLTSVGTVGSVKAIVTTTGSVTETIFFLTAGSAVFTDSPSDSRRLRDSTFSPVSSTTFSSLSSAKTCPELNPSCLTFLPPVNSSVKAMRSIFMS